MNIEDLLKDERLLNEFNKWYEDCNKLPTEIEKTILKNIDSDFKFIVRDEENNLVIYKNKPPLIGGYWRGIDRLSLTPFNHLFKFIKRNDKAFCIQELVNL